MQEFIIRYWRELTNYKDRSMFGNPSVIRSVLRLRLVAADQESAEQLGKELAEVSLKGWNFFEAVAA